MGNPTQATTACLDVTLQVNTAWVQQNTRQSRHRSTDCYIPAPQEETMVLCSDIICVDDELRSRPDFDTTAYVMNQALSHTRSYCDSHGATIRAFRSVEVLRMIQPGLPLSFLFIFEAIMVA